MAAGVGLVGFEPTTSCSQSRRAAKLRHSPVGIHYRFGPRPSEPKYRTQIPVKSPGVSYDAAGYEALPSPVHGVSGVRRILAAAASVFVLLTAYSSASASTPAGDPFRAGSPAPGNAVSASLRLPLAFYGPFSPVSPYLPPNFLPAPPSRDCSPIEPTRLFLWQTHPTVASVALSRAVYPCAEEVGLAPADDPQAAAALASGELEGPLLLVGEGAVGTLAAELDRLAPERVLAAGFGEEELAALAVAAGFADLETTVIEAPPAAAAEAPSPGGRIWLASVHAPAAPLAAAAARLGIGLAVAESSDLRALPAEARDAIRRAEQVDMVSEFGEDAAWQLASVRRGDEIPGGGLLMFDGGINRRIVAVYGHPVTSALGVLGEQGPERGVERLKRIAVGYDADGATVLPAFEIIATVASAGAGRDGDYSSETALDVIRPWIEAAEAAGVYVVLDLQPGRTDFLRQAKIYEEFLRLPHVGLALDPEWRLKPHQVHLRQIGTVDASEVNQVVRWLAGIVREEALPQKLLIVHQFRFTMITNRDRIETPPELAVVIQMDGQGSQGAKDSTWNALTRGTEESGYRWGWKNFYDEDFPTASPAKVLGLTPTPVFVSYQ